MRLTALFFVLLLLLAVAALPWLGRDLTEAPVPGGAQAAFTADAGPLSVVGFTASVPLSTLQQMADQRLPQVLVDETRKKRWKGKFLGIKASTSADVSLRILRRGAPTVYARGRDLYLRVPLSFKARIKARGGWRPSTHTDGSFTVTVRLRLDIDESWQPRVQVVGDYEWDQRPYLGTGPLRIYIADEVGDRIEEALEDGAAKLQEDLEEDLDLRDKAERAWQKLHRPRRLSDDRPLWLITQPESVHLQPLHAAEGEMRLAFALTARLQTLLTETPPEQEIRPLPPLQSTLPEQDGFVIDVPLLADYRELEALLEERLSGRRVAIRGGSVEATGIDVYGSDGQLVLGVAFEASAPWRLLDSRGKVWLTGRPEYDASTRTLVVRDLDFTRRVNNPLLWTASWILQDRLRAELRQRASFPLADRIDRYREKLEQRLQELGDEEWQTDSQVSELTVVGIEPLADQLMLRLRASGRLAAEWQPGETD